MAQKQTVTDKLLQNEMPQENNDLEKIGVRNLNSQDVANRIAAYNELQEQINSYTMMEVLDEKGKTTELKSDALIDLMVHGIVDINTLLSKMSSPWGAAGSERGYGEIMSAWKVIYSRCLNVATYIKQFIKTDYVDEADPEACKLEIVMEFYFTLFQLDYLAYAQFVRDLSWRRDDVANKWALTLYQPPMFPMGQEMGGQTLTSSGGRTSEDMRHPDQQPVPKRIPNKT